MEKDQSLIKRIFEKISKARSFQQGDLVLKWDVEKEKSSKNSTFYDIWSGPYMVSGYKIKNDFQFSKLDGEELQIPVDGIYIMQCY